MQLHRWQIAFWTCEEQGNASSIVIGVGLSKLSKFAALFALLAALQLLAPSVQAGPVIRVGETGPVSVGSTFAVPILVSDAVGLLAYQFDLHYDASLLELLGFSDLGTDFELAAIAGGGVLTGITGFALPGEISGIADSISGATSGLSGSGSLVEIEFRALMRGESALTLSGVFLDFASVGPEAIRSGTVSVSVPEPGAVWLTVSAMVLLYLQRSRCLSGRSGRSLARSSLG